MATQTQTQVASQDQEAGSLSVQATHELSSNNVPPPSLVPSQAQAADHGAGSEDLKSNWPIAKDLAGSALPCRLEGEVADLVVRGQVPKELDGTFFRV